MGAALIAVCGYVPVPLGREDFHLAHARQAATDQRLRHPHRPPHLRPQGPQTPTAASIRRRRTACGRSTATRTLPAGSGYGCRSLTSRAGTGGKRCRGSATPWVSAPFTDFTRQHIKRTVARRADRVSHEHDLALALREPRTRPGTRPARAAGTRCRRTGHPAGKGSSPPAPAPPQPRVRCGGVLYGQQPEAEADEPGEDVFGRQRGRRGALDRRRRPEHLAG